MELTQNRYSYLTMVESNREKSNSNQIMKAKNIQKEKSLVFYWKRIVTINAFNHRSILVQNDLQQSEESWNTEIKSLAVRRIQRGRTVVDFLPPFCKFVYLSVM